MRLCVANEACFGYCLKSSGRTEDMGKLEVRVKSHSKNDLFAAIRPVHNVRHVISPTLERVHRYRQF